MAGRCVRGTELLLSAGALGQEGPYQQRGQLYRGSVSVPGRGAGCVLQVRGTGV